MLTTFQKIRNFFSSTYLYPSILRLYIYIWIVFNFYSVASLQRTISIYKTSKQFCHDIWSIMLFVGLWTIPRNTIRGCIIWHFSGYLHCWREAFKNELAILLTTEWLVAYRYLLTFLFFSKLFWQTILIYYRTIRRPIRDRYLAIKHFFRYDWLYAVTTGMGFTVGVLLELQKISLNPLTWLRFLWVSFSRCGQYITQKSKQCFCQLVNWLTDRCIIFFYTFSWNIQTVLTIVSWTRHLRLRCLRTPRLFDRFYTFDEYVFFCSSVKRVIAAGCAVRLHDLFIPEQVELGYPVGWTTKSNLVQGSYDAGSYFFWATHQNLDKNLLPLLEKYNIVPPKIVSPNPVPQDIMTPHLQELFTWVRYALEMKKIDQDQAYLISEVVNELYYAFHDHFRVTFLDEIEKDPFFLIRLQSVLADPENNFLTPAWKAKHELIERSVGDALVGEWSLVDYLEYGKPKIKFSPVFPPETYPSAIFAPNWQRALKVNYWEEQRPDWLKKELKKNFGIGLPRNIRSDGLFKVKENIRQRNMVQNWNAWLETPWRVRREPDSAGFPLLDRDQWVQTPGTFKQKYWVTFFKKDIEPVHFTHPSSSWKLLLKRESDLTAYAPPEGAHFIWELKKSRLWGRIDNDNFPPEWVHRWVDMPQHKNPLFFPEEWKKYLKISTDLADVLPQQWVKSLPYKTPHDLATIFTPEELGYKFQTRRNYQLPSFADFSLDVHILERVCEHWSFIQTSSDKAIKLVHAYPPELTSFSSTLDNPKIFESSSPKDWLSWDFIRARFPQLTLKQWYDENWTYYCQQYIDSTLFYFLQGTNLFPMRFLIGNIIYNKEPYFDNFGWSFPIYSLQGVPWQDTWAFPCIIIYTIAAAVFLRKTTSLLFYNPPLYEIPFVEFNMKCQWLFGVEDITEETITDSLHWLAAIICIPVYYIPKVKPYFRRRLLTYCDIEYMRYIRRVARSYQAHDPTPLADPTEIPKADYFSQQFYESLSPLFPLRDKDIMSSVHRRHLRSRMTVKLQAPPNHQLGRLQRIWRKRYRKYAREVLTNGITFLEQDWLFAYFRFEGTIKRLHAPAMTPKEVRGHLKHMQNYLYYLTLDFDLEQMKKAEAKAQGDARRSLAFQWPAGFWRGPEVAQAGEQLRAVHVREIEEQEQRKEMFEDTMEQMLCRGTTNELQRRGVLTKKEATGITRYRDLLKHAAIKSNPSLRARHHVEYPKEDKNSPLPFTFFVFDFNYEHDLLINDLNNLFKPPKLKETPVDVYPFDALAADIAKGVYKTQYHRDRQQFRSVYLFFHFMKCLPRGIDVGPVADSLPDMEPLKKDGSGLLYRLVKLFKFWETWGSRRRTTRPLFFAKIPYLMSPLTDKNLSDRELFEKDSRVLMRLTNDIRTRKPKDVVLLRDYALNFNKLLIKYDEIRMKILSKMDEEPIMPTQTWGTNVNWLTFFTEEVICPPFGTEEEDNFKFYFLTDEERKRRFRVLPWSMVRSDGYDIDDFPAQEDYTRYILVASEASWAVHAVYSKGEKYFVPPMLKRLVRNVIINPIKKRIHEMVVRFLRTVKYVVTLGGRIKGDKYTRAIDIMLYPGVRLRSRQKLCEEVYSAKSLGGGFRRTKVLFDPYEWRGVYDRYVQTLYGKMGVLEPFHDRVYSNSQQLPEKGYTTEELVYEGVVIHRQRRLSRTFQNSNQAQRFPFHLGFIRPGITHERFMELLTTVPIRFSTIPSHLFDETKNQERVAIEDWYQFDNKIFDPIAYPGYKKRTPMGGMEEGTTHFNVRQKYEPPQRMTQYDFRRSKRRRIAFPELSTYWNYYDRIVSIKQGLRKFDSNAFLSLWPLDRELLTLWLRPLQYINSPTEVPNDPYDLRRRMLVKNRFYTDASASSLQKQKYWSKRTQLPTHRALDLVQAETDQPFPSMVAQLRRLRNLSQQQAVVNVYWQLFRTWSLPKKKHVVIPNKFKFSFREWLRVTPEMWLYFNDHRDRLQFFKRQNLSAPALVYERSVEARRREWGGVDMRFGKARWRPKRRNIFLRSFFDQHLKKCRRIRPCFIGKAERLLIANRRFWEEYLANRFGGAPLKRQVPFKTSPAWYIHIYDAIYKLKDPSEQLDLTFKLLENHNITPDHPAVMDFFFNDLAAALRREKADSPVLKDKDNLLESSLPGTIISPREMRAFWKATAEFNDYRGRLHMFFEYVNNVLELAKHQRDWPSLSKYNRAVKKVRNYETSKMKRNRFVPKPFNADETYWFLVWTPYHVDHFDLSEWNKWSWLFGCAGMTEHEQITFYRFLRTPVEDFWDAYVKVREEEKKKKKAAVEKGVFVELFDLIWDADLEEYPIPEPWYEKYTNKIINKSQEVRNVPYLVGDQLKDNAQTFIPYSTGYVRSNLHADEDTGWREYLSYMKGNKLKHWRIVNSDFGLFPRQKVRLEQLYWLVTKRNAIEHQQNPIIFADTPNSFAEYSSKEFLFDWELRRLDRQQNREVRKHMFPHLQELVRNPNLRKRLYLRHFSHFFDMIRKDWACITITPGMAEEMLRDFLVPELELLIEKQKTVGKVSQNEKTTPRYHNYKDAYIFDIVDDLTAVYELSEAGRQRRELALMEEIEEVKSLYKGNYYTQIREYFLDELDYQLRLVEGARQKEILQPYWRKGGFLWESRVLADWFIWTDTLGEIEVRDPIDSATTCWGVDSYLKSLHFFPTRGRGLWETGYDHYVFMTRFFRQDFDNLPYKFPYNDNHQMTFYLNPPHARYFHAWYWDKKAPINQKFRHLMFELTGNFDYSAYSYLTTLRFYQKSLFLDNLADNAIYHIGLTDRLSYLSQTYWYYVADRSYRLWVTASWEVEINPYQVQYFSSPLWFYPWQRMSERLVHLRDDYLLAGLYNVTQLTMTPVQFFTQTLVGGNGGTPDVFGLYCHRSFGRAPYEWYDLYDPITNRVVNTTPHLNFVFKEGKQFRRYFGYFMPETTWGRFANHWSIVDKIESITAGYTELESLYGTEYAVSQTLYKYFGVVPAHIIDFLLYTSYWGYMWLHAIYHGSIPESHVQQIRLMTPQDGLLELGLTGKDYERTLRAFQLKVLQSPEINYNRIVTEQLRKRELDTSNTYMFNTHLAQDPAHPYQWRAGDVDTPTTMKSWSIKKRAFLNFMVSEEHGNLSIKERYVIYQTKEAQYHAIIRSWASLEYITSDEYQQLAAYLNGETPGGDDELGSKDEK